MIIVAFLKNGVSQRFSQEHLTTYFLPRTYKLARVYLLICHNHLCPIKNCHFFSSLDTKLYFMYLLPFLEKPLNLGLFSFPLIFSSNIIGFISYDLKKLGSTRFTAASHRKDSRSLRVTHNAYFLLLTHTK